MGCYWVVRKCLRSVCEGNDRRELRIDMIERG